MSQSRAKRYKGFPSQADYRRAKKKLDRFENEAAQQDIFEHTLPEPYVPKHLTAAEHEWLRKVIKRSKRRQKATRLDS